MKWTIEPRRCFIHYLLNAFFPISNSFACWLLSLRFYVIARKKINSLNSHTLIVDRKKVFFLLFSVAGLFFLGFRMEIESVKKRNKIVNCFNQI